MGLQDKPNKRRERMKRILLIFALILTLSAACFAFTACGDDSANKISFKTLEVNGTDVYGSVPNEQTTFSFVDEINVSGGAKYVVALDEFGMQTVATKTVSLRPGDNTFYIIETVDDEATTVYAVVIHRKFLYTVSFDAKGTCAAETQYVEEGGLVKEPTRDVVTHLGLKFLGWDFDFSNPINESIVINAKTEACEEMKNFEFTSTDTTCQITGVKDKTVTEIIIPDYVTSIGHSAFSYCESLASVTIPSSVTTIGSFAFSYCKSLTSITIPDSITTIEESTFSCCESLASVTIPNSVTSIGKNAFDDCDSLVYVTIPDSVTEISSYAFKSCDSLASVTLGSGVENIYSSAFEYCYKLKEVINKSLSLNIKPGSSSDGGIGYYALEVHRGESKIDNVNNYLFYTLDGVNYLIGYVGKDNALILPESYDGSDYEICNRAFEMLKNITSVTIGNGVTRIGEYAFGACSNLADVTIGNGVTYIGEYAFTYCTALTDIIIPDNVVDIEEGAFCNCSILTSVTIPDSVTRIGNGAFSRCESLTIYCEASSEPDGWATYWNYSGCPVVWGYKG